MLREKLLSRAVHSALYGAAVATAVAASPTFAQSADDQVDSAALEEIIVTGSRIATDPNLVKLVCDRNGRALYFSRSLIPFDREESRATYFGHIGLYAYRVGFLKTYAKLKPCMLEQSEKLEQLRALYYGYNIHTERAITTPGTGVDTEQDLLNVTQQLKNLS